MGVYTIFILCVLYVSVDAWIGIIMDDPTSEHPGHCFTNERNIGSMEKFEVKRLEGECAEARCRENKDIKLTGCGPIAVRPPCIVFEGDLSEPFPKCCYEIICPEMHNVSGKLIPLYLPKQLKLKFTTKNL
ncbi:hypothetical protein JTB14_017789 [Gonioctena quinquepunctata]|nr:hypothetical protein JTB14_017789 [Gonioctena quinquepunctata]